MRRLAGALSLCVLCAIVAASSPRASASRDVTGAAAKWLASRQRPAGDLPGSTASGVGELIMALGAGHETGAPMEAALRYVRAKGDSIASRPAYAARIVMGLIVAGENPAEFGGIDYVKPIRNDPATGAYEDNVYANSIAALGAIAATGNLPGRAVTYIRAQQCANGGFSWQRACAGTPDVDTTATTLNALLASGLPASDTSVSRARTYLSTAENTDGGFGLEAGKPTNANSTGLAMSAIAALREDPTASPWRRPNGASPPTALLKLQDRSGGFRYLASSSEPGDYATIQATIGFARLPYPLKPVARADSPAASGAPAGGRTVQSATPAATPPAGAPEATHHPGQPVARHRAGLIVQDTNGKISKYCVLFDGPSVTGEQLLELSGVTATFARSQAGAAVCSLGGKGCSSKDCFCRYPTFWGYWNKDADASAWSFAQTGAAQRTVTDGSMDAWVWGRNGKPAPEPVTLASVCTKTVLASDEAVAKRAARGKTSDRTGTAGTLAAFGGVALILTALGWLGVRRRRRAA